MEEKKRNILKTVGALLVFLVVLIIIVLLILFNGHETYTSDRGEEKVVTALDCTARGIDGEFFASQSANTIENRIKVAFSDDKIDKMFYSFDGVYRTEEEAEHENAVLHAEYNKYLASYNIDHEILTPTFSTVNTKLQINLYAKNREMINRGTGKLFFINEEDVDDFLNYSREQVASYYKKQGFSCKKQN